MNINTAVFNAVGFVNSPPAPPRHAGANKYLQTTLPKMQQRDNAD